MRRVIILTVFAIFGFLSVNAQSVEQAESYYKSGDYEKAIEEYNSILEQGESSADLYFNLGNCYYKTGQNTKAIINYERAKRLAPADKELSKELVFTLVDDKNNKINTLQVLNAPLQRNWRTNIVGDILTGEGTFNVVIDPTYDDERNYWMEDSKLELPGDYSISGDIYLSQDMDNLGAIVDGSFQIKDYIFNGEVTIDTSVAGSGGTYELLDLTFNKTLNVSADVTIFLGGVNFDGNKTINWTNSNSSNRQIIFNANNPCYVKGTLVTKDNAKNLFEGASQISWMKW